MTDRQCNMMSEMKRGIKDALELIEQVEDMQAIEDTAQAVSAHYIGKLYQLAHLATIQAVIEMRKAP